MQWIPNEKKEPPEAGDYIEVTGRWGKRFVEILDPIKGNGDIVRFYFDPPQREWQSLTDDEIKEIIGSYSGPIKGYTRELFDKIEAKLREKNT